MKSPPNRDSIFVVVVLEVDWIKKNKAPREEAV